MFIALIRHITPGFVAQHREAAGYPAERILPGWFSETASVRRALEMARPGDLVVILGDRLSQVWDLIVNFKPGPADEEGTLCSAGDRVGALAGESRPN